MAAVDPVSRPGRRANECSDDAHSSAPQTRGVHTVAPATPQLWCRVGQGRSLLDLDRTIRGEGRSVKESFDLAREEMTA